MVFFFCILQKAVTPRLLDWEVSGNYRQYAGYNFSGGLYVYLMDYHTITSDKGETK